MANLTRLVSEDLGLYYCYRRFILANGCLVLKTSSTCCPLLPRAEPM